MKSVATILVVACAFLATWTPAAGQSCMSESFPYPDGELSGNDGWTLASGTSGRFVVSSQQAVMNFSDGTGGAHETRAVVDLACTTWGVITATMKVQANAASTGGGFAWSVQFDEINGNNLARWYGTPKTATPRIGGNVPPAPFTPVQLSTTGPSELKVVIDTLARHTYWYHTPYEGTEVLVWDRDWPAAVPAGTNRLYRVSLEDWERLDTSPPYSGTLLIDDIMIDLTPAPCLTAVTPLASDFITDNFLSVAEVSGVGFPASFTFTIENQSPALPISWTASEAKADGSATDYPWLSVAPASGGPLAAAGTADIVASVTPGASAGIYSGNVKITDDCNPAVSHMRPVVLAVGSAPCFVDPFQYVNGNLDGNGGWTGGGGSVVVAADPDNADNQVAKITMTPNTSAGATVSGLGCMPCEDGTIIVSAKVKGSPTGATVSRDWSIQFQDGANNAVAKFEGDYSQVRGRTMSSDTITDYTPITSTAFHELKAVIDIKNNLTTYYVDGTLMTGANPQTHGADLFGTASNIGDRIESIALSVESHPSAAGYMLIDDVQVVSCPGVCIGRVSPDRSQTGFTDLPHAVSGATTATTADGSTTYTKDYAFHNDGPASMSYVVEEVDADGNALADPGWPWLSLSKVAGGPVTGGTADPAVTISYDTTGLADGLYRGFVKFTDTCSPTRSYTRAIQLNVGDCLTEDFAYPDGNLESMPGWRTGQLNQLANVPQQPGGRTPYSIAVVNGAVQVNGASAIGTVEATHQMIDNCVACPGTEVGVDPPGCTPGTEGCTSDIDGNGLIVVKAKIKGTPSGGGSRYWNLQFTTNSGGALAQWRGAAEYAEANNDGGLARSLADGAVHELKAHINPNVTDIEGVPANNTLYFFDGVAIGIGAHPSVGANRVRLIRISRISNAATDPNPVVEIDDVSISACGPICGDPVFDVRDTAGAVARDQKVTSQDYNALSDCWSGPGIEASATAECQCLDATGDGSVDMADFALFQICFTGPSGGPVDPLCDN